MTIRSSLKWLAALIIVILAALFTLRMVRPRAITAEVKRDEAINAVSGTLTVEEKFRMQVRSESGERVVSTNMEVGQGIREGETILQLDTTERKLQIEAIVIQYEAHKDQMALGSPLKFNISEQEEALADLEELDEQGSVSPRQLKKSERRLEELKESEQRQRINDRSRLLLLENSLREKRMELAQMTVKSPIDGVIVNVFAYEGDLINPKSVVAEIISAERRILAKISEEDFAKVEVDQKATVRLLGYGKRLFNGSVVQILPTTDPDTQRYSVFLNVEIEREKLTPGLTGEVSIIVGQREDALLVPARAVFDGKVYVVNDSVVELRSVEKGFQSLNLIEIREGLKAGERIIVENLERFRDGDRVRLDKAD